MQAECSAEVAALRNVGSSDDAYRHRELHCVQHSLHHLPEPFGVALRAPVSVRHQWASPQHSSSNHEVLATEREPEGQAQRSNLVLCIRLAPLVGREHFVVVERQNTARPFTRHAASLPVRCSLLAVRFNL